MNLAFGLTHRLRLLTVLSSKLLRTNSTRSRGHTKYRTVGARWRGGSPHNLLRRPTRHLRAPSLPPPSPRPSPPPACSASSSASSSPSARLRLKRPATWLGPGLRSHRARVRRVQVRAQVRAQVGVRAGVMKSNRSQRAQVGSRLGFGIMLGSG